MLIPDNVPDVKKPILLFDGECNLCNGWVQFVMKRDRDRVFFFSSLQSELGRRVSQSLGLSGEDLKTLILVDESGYFLKSSAALGILKRIGLPWAMFAALLIVPKFARDAVYDFVARNRYRWFGKSAVCMLPTKSQTERFLS